MREGVSVRVPGEDVTFEFLGPTDGRGLGYECRLAESAERVVEVKSGSRDTARKRLDVDHNLVSGAFLVQYGSTKFVLGGDMVRDAWQDVLRSRGENLACQLLKASHHGSENGCCEGLYEALSRQGPPIMVLTPFNRNRNPLPTSEGIADLKKHVREVWVTSIDDARHALGEEPPFTDKELRRVRAEFRSRLLPLLMHDSGAWGAIDPEWTRRSGREPPPLASVPRAWYSHLREVPLLRRLIRRDAKSELPPLARLEPRESEYRLSFSFDDLGHEDTALRHVGRGCGPI